VRRGTALRIALGLVGAVLVLVAAGLLGYRLAPREAPAGQPPLATLSPGSLQAFRDLFNDGAHEARLLVLLSPT
jgi:hypothetical protein